MKCLCEEHAADLAAQGDISRAQAVRLSHATNRAHVTGINEPPRRPATIATPDVTKDVA